MYGLSKTARRFAEEDDDDAAEPPPVPQHQETIKPHAEHRSEHTEKKRQYHKSDAHASITHESKNVRQAPEYNFPAPRDTSTFDEDRNHMAARKGAAAAPFQMKKTPAFDTVANTGDSAVTTTITEEKAAPTVVGAVAVPGRLSENDGVSTYTDYSPGQESTNLADPPLAHDEPIVATRVTDSEDDIEAQVQSRMQNQAKDIARMVHQELQTNAAVPVEVQPTEHPDEQDKRVSLGKRRIIIFVSIGLLIVLGAVGAAVGVAVSKNKPDPTPVSEPTPTPTTSPTSTVSARFQAFQEVLEPISGEEFEDTGSPQYKALDWIVNRDEASLTVGVDDDESIAMRYTAAVVYYAFGGDGWNKKYNFLSKDHICEWKQGDTGSVKPFGISCDSDRKVDSLRLIENKLQGSIPREIGYFSNLDNLDLVNNTIRGSLDTLENLTRLENLRLAANQLTGTIPEFLFSHPVLSQLYLDDNRLEGTISRLLGTSTSLKHFWANGNELVGEIPNAIGQASVLQSIDLNSNEITGSIPEFTTSSLIYLWLATNHLMGPIPTSIGTLSSLKIIQLAGNSLAGTIPTELGNCRSLASIDFDSNELTGDIGSVINALPSSLEAFDVGGNELVGTIPTSIGTLSKLTYFDIQHNSVGGALPSEFGLLVDLSLLNLAYNKLSGLVPTALANLTKLTDLRLQGNNFDGNVNSLCSSGADFSFFAANTCTDPGQLECPCCTHCCNPDAIYCEFV